MGLDMYLKRRVAELEEKNADLEARLGHEQVVTMQNREAQLQGYIRDLGARVAALKKIAVEERSNFLYIYFHRSIVAKPLEPIECSNARLQDARRQLAEEHPEAFR